MLTIDFLLTLRKTVNYSDKLFSNQNMNSTDVRPGKVHFDFRSLSKSTLHLSSKVTGGMNEDLAGIREHWKVRWHKVMAVSDIGKQHTTDDLWHSSHRPHNNHRRKTVESKKICWATRYCRETTVTICEEESVVTTVLAALVSDQVLFVSKSSTALTDVTYIHRLIQRRSLSGHVSSSPWHSADIMRHCSHAVCWRVWDAARFYWSHRRRRLWWDWTMRQLVNTSAWWPLLTTVTGQHLLHICHIASAIKYLMNELDITWHVT